MKKKLTLSVNEDTLKKARSLGVNLSEVMGKILENLPELKDTNELTRADVEARWVELWRSVIPILKKYGVSIQVGFIYDGREDPEPVYEVHLSTDGCFYVKGTSEELSNIEKNNPFKLKNFGYYSDPSSFLGRLIDVIIKAKKSNEEQIEKLVQVKEVIENMKPLLVGKKNENKFVLPRTKM